MRGKPDEIEKILKNALLNLTRTCNFFSVNGNHRGTLSSP
ncbi:hypothetical protein TREPR_3622 [Treponema primitia ZAS-2]|uniref:Uncharacterized protein n=1 Tax=Treponema primitia (strain ATCC BAA-887 / DSM 12427 / ZAS-2) TaxID=545694 RepID=F5YR02_TREPZ|nr:hypothetical protein TREPR_3622 [Treponema primitia ZAS-2]